MSESSDGCLRNTIALLALLASWVVAAVAVKGCNDQHQQADEYSKRIGKLEKQVKSLNGQIENKDQELERKRAELEKGLLAYTKHYKDKIIAAKAAISYYQSFDTEANRKEPGDQFAKQHTKSLKDAKNKMQALVDHVQNWKLVLTEFEKLLNGRIVSLNESLIGNNIDQAFQRFGVIQENVDSDIDRLKAALGKATAK